MDFFSVAGLSIITDFDAGLGEVLEFSTTLDATAADPATDIEVQIQMGTLGGQDVAVVNDAVVFLENGLPSPTNLAFFDGFEALFVPTGSIDPSQIVVSDIAIA